MAEYADVWWNGLHGARTARRIYHEITERGHTVRAEEGTDERKVRIWDLPDESLACALVADLMKPEADTPPGSDWRETTRLYGPA